MNSSIDYLHNISVLGAIGGNIFDYFKDKSIVKINLYGNDDLVTLLFEQAFWLDIKIDYIISDTKKQYKVDFMERSYIKNINTTTIKNSENIKSSIYNTPIIFCEKPLNAKLFKNNYLLSDLLSYSLIKHLLFDRIIEYKKKFVKELKVVMLSLPSLWYVKNRNEYENSLLHGELFNTKLNKYTYKCLGKDDEYINEIFKIMTVYIKDNVTYLNDIKGEFVNIHNGHRVTTDIPESFENVVYTFGSSLCMGMRCEDKYTIQSTLQRKINQYTNNRKFAVLNCGNGGHRNFHKQWKSFEHHMPKKGDIAIFINWYNKLLVENYSDVFHWCTPQKTSRIFDRPHDLGEYVYIDRVHYTYIGYSELGNYLGEYLVSKRLLDESKENNGEIWQTQPILSDVEKKDNTNENYLLHEYLKSLKTFTQLDKKTGAIVMNCNPFTLGHRYLIEYAASKCDLLFIFAVEEDRSFFPFADRISLIKTGTEDIPHVIVLPSGSFIISKETFPAYFEKESMQQDEIIDATYDVELFATKIAPTLNITTRFVGEEPLDNVTRQYNMQMGLILPKHGIKLEIIPRKEIDGEVISASRVRKFLAEKDFNAIAKLVPKCTFDYLLKWNAIDSLNK